MSKRLRRYWIKDLAIAATRKTNMGRANKVIDAFAEDNIAFDTLLHFINEAVIHKKPKTFLRQTLKYTAPKLIK